MVSLEKIQSRTSQTVFGGQGYEDEICSSAFDCESRINHPRISTASLFSKKGFLRTRICDTPWAKNHLLVTTAEKNSSRAPYQIRLEAWLRTGMSLIVVSVSRQAGIGCRKASAAGAGAGRKALEVRRHRTGTMEAFALCLMTKARGL